MKYDDEQGLPFYAKDMADILREKGMTVEQATWNPTLTSWKHCLSWVPSCVSAIKINLGIPTLALTPRQMYTWVKNN